MFFMVIRHTFLRVKRRVELIVMLNFGHTFLRIKRRVDMIVMLRRRSTCYRWGCA